MLVVDNDLRYVAVSTGVRDALGYEPSELIGLRIADIAAPDLVAGTPEWQRFLEEGRQDGTFRLRARRTRRLDALRSPRPSSDPGLPPVTLLGGLNGADRAQSCRQCPTIAVRCRRRNWREDASRTAVLDASRGLARAPTLDDPQGCPLATWLLQ